MCGIAGILCANGPRSADALRALATPMGEAIAARGPDSHGLWVDEAAAIAMVHRRLSILDLSPEGHQPMHSACGRYVISYNGEIYNYRELRAQLDHPWRGQSDTEVLLAAIAHWGVADTLGRLNGMFAFALWDRKERSLTLARDRMGEKPLYYGQVGGDWVFASELKAFGHLPGWPPSINHHALHSLMRNSYIGAPHSIYEGIYKLPPAHFLTLRNATDRAAPMAYWSFADMAARGVQQRFTGSKDEALAQLEHLMAHAVKQRMVADVPLGVFLSGGIDSSAIAALMQQQSAQPVRSFTIGFAQTGFDEAPYAKAVARHLGTDHHELYVSAADTLAVIEHLPTLYDEPFADSSQIPTFLVSQFARQQVTVALSGDGGDELFGGYNRYRRGPALWRAIAAMPLPLRRLAAHTLHKAHNTLMPYLPPGHSRRSRLAHKLQNYYDKITAPSAASFYRTLCSIHDHPADLLRHGAEPPTPFANAPAGLPYAEWMMLQDALTYFPGDILTKVDRAAMGVSLETRTPFTDLPLMEFAWQLPLHMKLHRGQGKALLRALLYRHVPPALIDRPKAGFAVPIGAWLRGSLKPWASDLLSPALLAAQGLFHEQAVQALWAAHQSGQRDHAHALWNILMFQSWLAHQR